MSQDTYPSLPVSIKDIRFLLRRMNRCIRDIDESLSDNQLTPHPSQIITAKISDLIYSKAQKIIYGRKAEAEANRENNVFDDNSNIFNELIKPN